MHTFVFLILMLPLHTLQKDNFLFLFSPLNAILRKKNGIPISRNPFLGIGSTSQFPIHSTLLFTNTFRHNANSKSLFACYVFDKSFLGFSHWLFVLRGYLLSTAFFSIWSHFEFFPKEVSITSFGVLFFFGRLDAISNILPIGVLTWKDFSRDPYYLHIIFIVTQLVNFLNNISIIFIL